MYYVYKITNLINGKIYIGITTKTIEKRWAQHVYSSQNSQSINYDNLLHKAMRKYGLNSFKIECIDTCNDIDTLKQKEIQNIQIYNSYMPQGYNMTFGGDLNTHFLGELSPVSKNTDTQRWTVINLLQTTNLSFSDIAVKVELNSENGEKLVDLINRGENFFQPELNYPIRKNAKSIAKQGEKNPMADKETALKIIDLLINTDYTQEYIAFLCHCHINTVCDINRCKRWTELHKYSHNIREECGITIKTKQQLEMEPKALQIIEALEEGKTNDWIRLNLHTSLNMISDINNCRKYQYLHHYKNNIRKESRGGK